ncbi:hypothetical protein PI93_001805 [Pandoraea fibrosis]|uniref:Uncharacterized protein n=1 Tax=Pandoraea fibrosis TaxID=1891094 RepID=A0ABX6HLZ5_9BURK|nr:hypothetical protein [Pandoraea fibrosis]QHE90688.1 hypothetical protein PJ20_001805 [Pandoraea fibrosis]QHF11519.1 hypothetical protein PI93_001805 [Pandoraea fibrosis]
MPFASHPRVSSFSPCYGLPHAHRHHERKPDTPAGLPRAFRSARCVPQETGSRALLRRERTRAHRSPNDTVWPAALAILLVANLATPAAGAVLSRAFHSDGDDDVRGPRFQSFNPGHMPDAQPSEVEAPISSAHDDVIIRPVEHASSFKTEYTFEEFVRAVSTASAPFHHLGESMGEAYEVLSGSTVSPGLRESVRKGADALDFATGWVPQVRLTRLPGDLASVVSDELEGKSYDPEKLIGLLQFGDPRSLGSGPQAHADSAHPIPASSARRPAEKSWLALHFDALRPEPEARDVSLQARPPARGQSGAGPRETHPGQATHPALKSAGGRANDPASASRPHIVGEHEHLQGYAQTLTADQLPSDALPRVVVVNAQHFLRGEAGFYRVQKGLSADHWLVDAPRGSESRAQVPVTYDAGTGKWQAHAPLRLCGGGCGASRLDYVQDSIAGSLEDIYSAIRHVPDEGAQEAIQNAFVELSELHLRRTNRADLRPIRDNSIVNHRAVLRNAMNGRVDPHAPLIKQQRDASTITAIYYEWNVTAEAFCQENAEILFHALLQNGISKNQIRMITIKPKNRPPHVMVLYTESEHFIELMDRSTPQPPNPGYRDGINHELFREAAYLTRQSTVLLDPWSTTKAISFASTTSRIDAGRVINRALIDIGHLPGNEYTVSVTRPLGAHRVNARGRGNSLNSEGTSSQSATSTMSRGGSLASGDTLPSQLEEDEAEV